MMGKVSYAVRPGAVSVRLTGRHRNEDYWRLWEGLGLSFADLPSIGKRSRGDFRRFTVLRTYLWRKKAVTPINPREAEIEGQKCAKSLSDLTDPKEVAVSVVTPPAVTLGVIEEANRLGITRLWLQPGSENEEVVSRATELGLQLIHGEPCVLVELGYYAPGCLGSKGVIDSGGGGEGSGSAPSL